MNADQGSELLNYLRAGETTVWLSEQTQHTPGESALKSEHVSQARERLARFSPVLKELFPEENWDGKISSPLLSLPTSAGFGNLLVKADHQLPVAGSVKARGGINALLRWIEDIGLAEGILPGSDYLEFWSPKSRKILGKYTVLVASTGNLGFSIGKVARAFGMNAQVHMSQDAKAWKRERLKALGADVIAHSCDYATALVRARKSATQVPRSFFIDDENSLDLMAGYATAAPELAAQLAEREIAVDLDHPLIVLLPCGVGGAPGGITFGLKAIFGRAAFCAFVEPTASACVLSALALGNREAVSIYDLGLDNVTIADGLAVSRASQLVLDSIGDQIDAVVALPDELLLSAVRDAWYKWNLRLEPSAASVLAAIPALRDAIAEKNAHYLPKIERATWIAWTTGGSLLPDSEFHALLDEAARGSKAPDGLHLIF